MAAPEISGTAFCAVKREKAGKRRRERASRPFKYACFCVKRVKRSIDWNGLLECSISNQKILFFMAKKAIRNEKQKFKGAAGDDRNLVLVDDDFQDADFEDKVWLFWRRHGKKTVAVAALIFFAALAAIIYTQGKKIHVQSLQNDYALLKTDDERRAFARENTADPMAGTVFYMLGNTLFREGKFADAAADYHEAASVFSNLSGTEYALPRDRARLAEAASLQKSGKQDEAVALLTALAGTLETDETIRGQAMYNLAVIALAKNDLETARNWLNEMDRALAPQNMWHAQKQNLLRIDPRLIETPTAEQEAPAAGQ